MAASEKQDLLLESLFVMLQIFTFYEQTKIFYHKGTAPFI